MSLLSGNNPNQVINFPNSNNNTNESETCEPRCDGFQPEQMKVEESKSSLKESANFVENNTFINVLRRLSRQRRVKQRSILRELESRMEQEGHNQHQQQLPQTQQIKYHRYRESSCSMDSISIEDDYVDHTNQRDSDDEEKDDESNDMFAIPLNITIRLVPGCK